MTPETLLHRQIHPSWIQRGEPTSQAFGPTPKDQRRLSVYDGDQVTAEQAWNHFTGQLGYPSVGVQAVSARECEELELPVEPDPAPFPAHVAIRFDGCASSGQVKKKAELLKARAASRGWLYRADAQA